MSSGYEKVRASRLKLKSTAGGGVEKKRIRKAKAPAAASSSSGSSKVIDDADAIDHGGWWRVTDITHLSGLIAIECGLRCYVKALDSGQITVGPHHPAGAGPEESELFMAVRVGDDKVALKSGYGKFLSTSIGGQLQATSEAIASLEQFQPIFEENDAALLASNQCFIAIVVGDDAAAAESVDTPRVVALSTKVGADERLRLRSNATRIDKSAAESAAKRNVRHTEETTAREFQSFQDHKFRLNPGDIKQLKEARKSGTLREMMLDRREKMKSDKFCK